MVPPRRATGTHSLAGKLIESEDLLWRFQGHVTICGVHHRFLNQMEPRSGVSAACLIPSSSSETVWRVVPADSILPAPLVVAASLPTLQKPIRTDIPVPGVNLAGAVQAFCGTSRAERETGAASRTHVQSNVPDARVG